VSETGGFLRPPPREHAAGESAAGQIRAGLESAVREHLLSDVPVAVFLSGGLDSSTLAALAARTGGPPPLTVTVGVGDAALDESAAASAFARRAGTEHIALRLSDEEGCAAVAEAVAALDLPSADGPNTFVVSRTAARAGVKVALSGLGGDELFGGYRSFAILRALERWDPLLKPAAPLARLASRGRYARLRELAAPRASLSDRYETLRAFWARTELDHLGLPTVGYALEEPPAGLSPSARVSLLELGGYLRSTLLRDADAMSMASSLELRVPFLDLRLVETCLRLDAARARGGLKQLLRDAVADLVGPEAGRGVKRGFELPMARWMRGPLEPFVALGLKRLSRSGLLPRVDLAGLDARFRAGRLGWARLWQFVVLGHWSDTHLGQ
jgi:asparagine synthase (glutamine-hydrolysing)